MTSFFLRLLLPLVLGLAAPAIHAAGADTRPIMLVLGDSLGAAYGVPAERGWVALLQKRLDAAGYPARVVNASVSGETTAGGLARLPALLERHRPRWVLIELGGNDGLRGLPLTRLRDNLRQIGALSRAAGATPIYFEMRIPTNYGADYADGFAASFGEVARALKAPLVPFFLAEIATDPASFQDDGIHPTAAVQDKLLDAVWPTLRRVLAAGASR
ncbi:arylesterase [Fontimonas sp. SYSU GA230001]|uniref:arylesterase n=1 Tax=Fontimonas sp. SYSU GA230001 TaxID=3142450 RepID=UPI0032B39E6B